MSLPSVLGRVVDILDGADVPYMLTGSLAAAYHATPRATKDLDMIIETDAVGIGRLVDSLHEGGFYADREAALEALRTEGQFNAIDTRSGWKVDLILRKDRAFSRTEFDRRERAEILGVQLSLASVEDVLIAKMEWSRMGDSELQRRDVVQLVERAWSRLDHDYLERWIEELDLEPEWMEALARAGRTTGSDPETE